MPLFFSNGSGGGRIAYLIATKGLDKAYVDNAGREVTPLEQAIELMRANGALEATIEYEVAFYERTRCKF